MRNDLGIPRKTMLITGASSGIGYELTRPNTILVAYASRAGSTAGVAEAIGQTLAESGYVYDDSLPLFNQS